MKDSQTGVEKGERRGERKVLINSYPQHSEFSPRHYAKYLWSYKRGFFLFLYFFFEITIHVIIALALQHTKKCFILFASLGSHVRLLSATSLFSLSQEKRKKKA